MSVTRGEDLKAEESLLGSREEPLIRIVGWVKRSEFAISWASWLVMPAMATVNGMLRIV
jgi:hypothetical protein